MVLHDPNTFFSKDVPEKKKRGRKSMATILAENQTPKQDAPHDSQDEDTEKNVVSRSGRKIKPKRFHDFDGAELPIDSSRNGMSFKVIPSFQFALKYFSFIKIIT